MKEERQPLDAWAVLPAVAVCVITLVVVCGWLFDAPVLQSFVPDRIGMKLVTATTFLMAAVAVLGRASRSTAFHRFSAVLAIAITVLGLLSIVQDLTGLDLSIDRMWIAEKPGAVETIHPGRMAFNTAFCFAAVGIALLLSQARSRVPSVVARLLLLVVGIISIQVLIGYVFNAPQLRSSDAATPMALPTALDFALLAYAGARLRKDEWPMSIVFDDSASGAAARALLPASLVVTIGFGWLALLGEERHWYGTSTETALYAITVVLAMSAITIFAASRLHRIETGRQKDRDDLGRAIAAQDVISTAPRQARAVEQAIVDQSRMLVNAAGAALVVLEQGVVIYRTTSGTASCLEGLKAEAGRSFVGVSMLENRPSIIENLSENEAMDVTVRERIGGVSVAVLPLRAAQIVLGAIVVFGEAGRPIGPQHLDLLRVIANAAAAALVQSQQFELGQFMLLEQAGELAALQEQFSAFMKNIPAAAFIKDEGGRYQFANAIAADFLGCEIDDIPGSSDEDILPPARARTLHDQELSVLASGRAAGQVVQFNESSWLLLDFPILIGGGRKFLGGVAIDITEQKRAERQIVELNATLEARVAARTEQLERTNDELEAFTYSVSHDLRSPLRAVSGYSRILEEDYSEALHDEAKRFLATIRAEAQRMGTLIDDLLAFSRIGRQSLSPAPLDIAQLARDVIREEERQRPDRTIEFVCDDLPHALADRSTIRQVLVNLLSNAVKYAKAEGPIRIQMVGSAGDEFNTYSIRDHGVGFDMRYADKLFGVFQRLHSAEEFEGTGVGLAIVERIVTRHGGRVWAEATVGEGATFWFTLPVAGSKLFDESETQETHSTIPRAAQMQEKI